MKYFASVGLMNGYGPQEKLKFGKFQLRGELANIPRLSKMERKNLKRIYRTELVKRAALLKIVAAWLITVPTSGALAALFFSSIRGMMLE